jgi:predicted enzyme related to lactoylglutathione lyase
MLRFKPEGNEADFTPNYDVAKGFYELQFGEDIKRITKEETQSVGYLFPMTVVGVMPEEKGEVEENVGKNLSIYVNILDKEGNVNERGEKQFSAIMVYAGLENMFENVPDDPGIFASDAVLDIVAAGLPGKIVGGLVVGKKSKYVNDAGEEVEGRMNYNVFKWKDISGAAGQDGVPY